MPNKYRFLNVCSGKQQQWQGIMGVRVGWAGVRSPPLDNVVQEDFLFAKGLSFFGEGCRDESVAS